MVEESRQFEELLARKEQQYEVQRQIYEEGFRRKLRAHEEFHDKELEDEKIIIRRLAALYKKLRES